MYRYSISSCDNRDYEVVAHEVESFKGTRQILNVEPLSQIHDILIDGKYFYIVWTKTNKITKHSLDGKVIDCFIYPGERNSMHINCLGKYRGTVVFTAFGDFRKNREWDLAEDKKNSGFIREIGSEKTFVTGLSQPHSPLGVGENLLVANSGNSEVIEFGKNGEQLRLMSFEGYPRGLCMCGGVLYVGVSSDKKNTSCSIDSAKIVAVDYQKWETIGEVALPTKSVYAVRSLSHMPLMENRLNLLLSLMKNNDILQKNNLLLSSIKNAPALLFFTLAIKELYRRAAKRGTLSLLTTAVFYNILLKARKLFRK